MSRAFISPSSEKRNKVLLKRANSLQALINSNVIQLRNSLEKPANMEKVSEKRENEFLSKLSPEMKLYLEAPLYPSNIHGIAESIPSYPRSDEDLAWRFDVTDNDDIKVPTLEESEDKVMSYIYEVQDNEDIQPE